MSRKTSQHDLRPETPRESFAFDRSDLDLHVEAVLHHGGAANPDVLLVRDGQRQVVVKDFTPRHALIRSTWGRWAIAHERRVYGRLSGVEAIPRFLGVLDAYALIIEYRPGQMLTRSLIGSLPRTFIDDLARSVAQLHAIGVVHLDLRHRSNILLGRDGRPVLLDFASAICIRPSTFWKRRLLGFLGKFDRNAVNKWREKFSRTELAEEEFKPR